MKNFTMASKLIVFPFLVGMGSSLNEVVGKYEIVTMNKSRKFDVKTNSKIKESQDNAQTKKMTPQRHKEQRS